MQDPFAAAPAEEAANTPAKETPAVATAYVDVKPRFPEGFTPSEGKVVVTLKGDGAPPWIVIHAEDSADALGQFDNNLSELMTKAQNATQHFASINRPAVVANNGGGQQLQPGQPAGSVQPPSWAPPMPDGYKYATGEKNGRVWHAYFPIDQRSGLQKQWLNAPR